MNTPEYHALNGPIDGWKQPTLFYFNWCLSWKDPEYRTHYQYDDKFLLAYAAILSLAND